LTSFAKVVDGELRYRGGRSCFPIRSFVAGLQS
jgi:hypothetical protein